MQEAGADPQRRWGMTAGGRLDPIPQAAAAPTAHLALAGLCLLTCAGSRWLFWTAAGLAGSEKPRDGAS